jgi:hypothetical protein
MKKVLLVVITLALLGIALGPACANPWPDWSAAGSWPYVTVATTEQASPNDNIFDFLVNVDPGSLEPGWGIKAFVVYADDIIGTPFSQSETTYDAGNTAGWTGLNGGWEWGKLGPSDSAAFGWQTGSPSTYVMSGNSATFSANLGAEAINWDLTHFAVHVSDPNGNTFWAAGNGDNVVPEPASLALLGSGLVSLASWAGLKRRCRK